MDIMAAWGLGFRGQGVTVGVVDTGVEVSHIDLAPNIVSYFHFCFRICSNTEGWPSKSWTVFAV